MIGFILKVAIGYTLGRLIFGGLMILVGIVVTKGVL